MSEIAMYYPFIHIRDDEWLKAAALYWPRLARLTPPGYPTKDSDVAKALSNELGFLLGVEPPRRQVAAVANEFIEFLQANPGRLRSRYLVRNSIELLGAEMYKDKLGKFENYRGIIHQSQMTPALASALDEMDLAWPIDDSNSWIWTHPEIASAYTIALVNRVASANNLAVVTDQTELHQVRRFEFGQEFEDMLLPRTEPPGEWRPTDNDIATMYMTIAIQTVVPANLESVPVDKIIRVRRKLAVEFDLFREHLGVLANEFAALTAIENPTILRARLQMLVDRDLRRPTAALERSLRQLGLEPAKAILGLKTVELPAVAATATSALGLPLVAGQAGLVAAHLVAASLEARSKRQTARQSGPAGYLLGVDRYLGARSMVQRVRQMLGSDPRR